MKYRLKPLKRYAEGGEILTPGKLIELIKAGEGVAAEFKASFDKEAIETSVAFANTKGGVILIGVSDKGYTKII